MFLFIIILLQKDIGKMSLFYTSPALLRTKLQCLLEMKSGKKEKEKR